MLTARRFSNDNTPSGSPRWRNLLALVLALGVVAAGCGDDDDASSEGEAPSDAGSSAEPSGEPIVIGALLPLSGNTAEIGELFREGEEMAVEELNDSGGILGRPIEIIFVDDGGDPSTGAQAARELVDREQVDLVVGSPISGVIGVELPIVQQADLLTVVQGTLPEAGDASAYPYVFRTEVMAEEKGRQYIDFAVEQGWEKVAAIGSNDALGKGNLDGLNLAADEAGIEVVSALHEPGATDQTAAVAGLVDSGASVLFALNTGTPDQIGTIRARNELAWDVPLIGSSNIVAKGVRDTLGESGLENVYAGNFFVNFVLNEDGTPTNEDAFDWVERYAERRGEESLTVSGAVAAGGYDSVMMLAEAIEKAGSLDDPDAVRKVLEEDGHEGMKASYSFTSERHDGIGAEDMTIVVAGSLEGGFGTAAPEKL